MKYWIYILGALFALSSCQEEIDFDLNTEKSRIVIEGEISDGLAKHTIKITSTTSYYFNESAPVVENANVTISDGDSTWTLIEEEPGLYMTPELRFDYEKSYKLTIDNNGEIYEGEDYLFTTVQADSIEVKIVQQPFQDEGGGPVYQKDFYSIFLHANEPVGLGDCYMWKYWVKKPDTAWKDMTPTFSDWIYSDDEFIDGNSPSGGWEMFDYIPVEDFPQGTVVRMEMYKISRSYLEFLEAMGQQTFRTGFFDGPPANIPSNMNNGALGYFSAVGVDTTYATVK